MTYTKTFNYKGQMVNYYNKVRNNPAIQSCTCYYSVSKGMYVVNYKYKEATV